VLSSIGYVIEIMAVSQSNLSCHEVYNCLTVLLLELNSLRVKYTDTVSLIDLSCCPLLTLESRGCPFVFPWSDTLQGQQK